jgi:hypothetical protein
MHGLTWRELEWRLPDQGHQGTDNRPGNQRHKALGPTVSDHPLLQPPTRPLRCGRSVLTPGVGSALSTSRSKQLKTPLDNTSLQGRQNPALSGMTVPFCWLHDDP